jgi:HK97 family phage portal protein
MGWMKRWRARREEKRLERIRSKVGPIELSRPADMLRYLPPQFKSITSADLNPEWMTRQPFWSRSWTLENSYTYGMKKCAWVFACIYRRSKAIASLPWYVERRTRTGWERVQYHPAAELIEHPNPYWTRQDLFETMIMHLDLDGNSILAKVRPGGENSRQPPKEVWLISPDRIKPVLSTGPEPISHYEARSLGELRKFRVETRDVIHFRYCSPVDEYWGISPMLSAGRAVDADVEMTDWIKVSMQNRAVASGVFSFDHEISQEQYDQAVELIEEQHMGADNALRPWVLGSGARWHSMSMSPQEMDFIESRGMNMKEICSVYGVPLPIIGEYADATLANLETSRTIFWLDTIIPLADDLKSTLNRTLAPEYGDDIRYAYDLSKVQALFSILRERIQAAKDLWSMGVPLNVASETVNLNIPKIEGGDVGYIPGNLMPISSSSEAPMPPLPTEEGA